jgi:hypothetical protein
MLSWPVVLSLTALAALLAFLASRETEKGNSKYAFVAATLVAFGLIAYAASVYDPHNKDALVWIAAFVGVRALMRWLEQRYQRGVTARAARGQISRTSCRRDRR